MTLEVRFLITCSSSVPHDQPHKPSCVYSLQYIAAWEPRVQLIAKKRLTFPKNKTDSPVKVAELGQVKCKKVKPYKKIHKTWKAKEVMKALQKKTKNKQTNMKNYTGFSKQSLSMIITLVLTVICKNLFPPDFCAFREMFSLHEVLGK